MDVNPTNSYYPQWLAEDSNVFNIKKKDTSGKKYRLKNSPLNNIWNQCVSCVCKTYSGILNNRLVNFFEDEQWLVDEQNGFHKGRSCQDHIFSFTSIIRNRLNFKLPTFSVFVDFQKALDWIDRDLLFYKLLNHINGKMYVKQV